MLKLNGRLGRLLLNPSPSLLLMTQSSVQHMPKKMTYLLWRDGVDSEALPRRIRSMQEQLSKVRSGKWFRAIIGHQGPLLGSDPDQKGSKYNVQVEWETEEITFEPLSIVAPDNPVICAAYAKENDLLALEGWCSFRSLAKKDKVLTRAIKRSKMSQVRGSQTYMFGCLIPINYMEGFQKVG